MSHHCLTKTCTLSAKILITMTNSSVDWLPMMRLKTAFYLQISSRVIQLFNPRGLSRSQKSREEDPKETKLK